ncbi:MAG: hypothetical protein AAFP98_11575 [Pseudomonadota bacterium]
MRPLHLSDLHVAACALRGRPASDQVAAIRGAIAAADTADRYRKRLRKAHPDFGTGTLSSVFGTVDEPNSCDAAYLAALAVVVAALRDC